MEVPIIQRRVVKSISEFSVFKIALIAYLIVFIISVILMAIIALITWAGFAASGINFNDMMDSSFMVPMLSGLGLDIPSSNLMFGTGGIVGIVLFIVFGLIFSVVFAAIATFWTWVFNVILKISGGFEVRYLDRTIRTETKIVENSNISQ